MATKPVPSRLSKGVFYLAYQRFTLHHFDRVEPVTLTRLHNLGLHDGVTVTLIQRYPFHGPVIIENSHQRIALRHQVFTTLASK